jgi:hypothetical protein
MIEINRLLFLLLLTMHLVIFCMLRYLQFVSTTEPFTIRFYHWAFRIPTLEILLCRPIMFDNATTVLMFAPVFLCGCIIVVHLLPSMYVIPNLNTMVIDLTARWHAPLTSKYNQYTKHYLMNKQRCYSLLRTRERKNHLNWSYGLKVTQVWS